MDDADAGAARGGRMREGDLASLDAHASAVRLINAAEDLDQCRLSGAVFAAQRMNLTGGAVKAHAIERPHAGEALADVEHFQSERCLRHVILPRAHPSVQQRVYLTAILAEFWLDRARAGRPRQ